MREARAAVDPASVRSLFGEVVELDPADRAARLAGIGGEVAREIEELLRHHESSGRFDALNERLTPTAAGRASSPEVGDGPDSFQHPRRIGPYELLRVIGAGGMGVVYEAEQREPVRRRVALKMLREGMDTREVMGRFEAERQALAVMEHAGIAKVLDAGATEQGRPYFVMELVRGLRLDEYCDDRRLTTRRRVELFAGVCDAVQHAHLKGVVHRDLKPSNVLVVEDAASPQVKIIDFGIAKATGRRLSEQTVVTSAGQALGTLAYMSPEQAETSGLDVDTRADVYSLGVMLYQLLTGFVPIDPMDVGAARFLAGLVRRDSTPPTPSRRVGDLRPEQRSEVARLRGTDEGVLRNELEGDLEWIVLKAIENDRGRRYETASALAADLRRFLLHEPVEAHPPSVAYRAAKFVRRNTIAVTAAALAGLALMVGGAMTYVSRDRAVAAQQVAVAEAERAEAVNQFLVTLFGSASPAEDGREVRVADVLDRASAAADDELAPSLVAQAAVRFAIGRTYRGLGLYAEAIREIERSAEAYRRIGGAALGDVLFELGSLQSQLGDYESARVTQDEQLAHMRALDGERSEGVADALSAIAERRFREGDFRESASVFRQALDIYVQLLPDTATRVIHTRGNLAVMMQQAGDYDEAIRLNQQLLPTLRTARGPDHIDVASVSGNLAIVLQNVSRYEEAEPLLVDALRINRLAYGDSSDRVARSLNNLGALYRRVGRFRDSERALREAVAINAAVLGTEHAETASNLLNLGQTLLEMGEAERAAETIAQALGINERVRPGHPTVPGARSSLANALLRLDRIDEAEALLVRARTETVAIYGEEHLRVAGIDIRLAECWLRTGRLSEAEAALLAALPVARAGLPASRREVQTAYDHLARVYDALGRPERAAEYHALASQLE